MNLKFEMITYKYYTIEHRGTLEEAIATKKKISKRTFEKLIRAKIYYGYSYDERIKAMRYLLSDLEDDIGLPAWILVEEVKKEF